MELTYTSSLWTATFVNFMLSFCHKNKTKNPRSSFRKLVKRVIIKKFGGTLLVLFPHLTQCSLLVLWHFVLPRGAALRGLRTRVGQPSDMCYCAISIYKFSGGLSPENFRPSKITFSSVPRSPVYTYSTTTQGFALPLFSGLSEQQLWTG